MKVSWIMVLPEHDLVKAVAESMRPADREEVRLLGLNPLTALYTSVAASSVALAGMADGVPVCIFGGRPGPVVEGDPRCGLVWELGTTWIDRNRRAFLRECRHGLSLVWDALDVDRLSNIVWTGNVASMRWLTWLGASWSCDEVEGLEGSRFARFTLERG